MLKQLAIWAVVAFFLFWIVSDPTSSSLFGNNVLGALNRAASATVTFVQTIAQ